MVWNFGLFMRYAIASQDTPRQASVGEHRYYCNLSHAGGGKDLVLFKISRKSLRSAGEYIYGQLYFHIYIPSTSNGLNRKTQEVKIQTPHWSKNISLTWRYRVFTEINVKRILQEKKQVCLITHIVSNKHARIWKQCTALSTRWNRDAGIEILVKRVGVQPRSVWNEEAV